VVLACCCCASSDWPVGVESLFESELDMKKKLAQIATKRGMSESLLKLSAVSLVKNVNELF
jgi:hypothetical protein